ncbi:MAG: DUF3473 domain-containing protein [Thermoanaerobaculaceae bacterium]
MLDLFAEHGARATCFVLGDVAEAFPGLIRRIVAAGHELGVHGWHHHRIFQLDRSMFGESLRRAKGLLEELSGRPVLGYRAVAMSITRETWWAYDVISELGFLYSSSIYPFRGSRYGVPGAPLGPHRVRTAAGAELLEIPLSVAQLGPLRLPVLGGGYLRHFPFLVNRWALRALEREGRRAVVYLHPYELEVGEGAVALSAPLPDAERAKVRRFMRGQLRNRQHTQAKVRGLLSMARFSPIEDVFQAELAT